MSNSYPLHWLRLDSRCSVRHNKPLLAACFPFVGWSDRHGFRGNAVGSLQPTPVFCPCPKSTAASNATSMLRKTSLHRKGERNGEPQREPCLSCTVHLSAPGKASKPFPRISIGNGFTRPTGDINVNSPPYTQRPCSQENLTENLCDLPFFFRGPATRRLPPALPWRPTRVRR